MLRSVRVVPRASKNEVVEQEAGGTLTIRVTATPTENKANKATLTTLGKHLGLPTSKLRIKSGHKSKNKIIEIFD